MERDPSKLIASQQYVQVTGVAGCVNPVHHQIKIKAMNSEKKKNLN